MQRLLKIGMRGFQVRPGIYLIKSFGILGAYTGVHSTQVYQ